MRSDRPPGGRSRFLLEGDAVVEDLMRWPISTGGYDEGLRALLRAGGMRACVAHFIKYTLCPQQAEEHC